MPRIYDLSEYSQRLNNVHLIVGDGLCSNIYVIGLEKITIIDAGIGNWMNPIFPQLNLIGAKVKNIDEIILTHAHHDHVMGVFLILEKVKPKVFVHFEDTKYIASRLGDNLVKVKDGDKIDSDQGKLEVYWTPGHTVGSMCLYQREKKILYSGDTVFPDGGFGRFDGESGSLNSIINSIKKLSNLDIEVMLPGHGFPVFKGSNEHILLSLENASQWS